MKSRIVLAVAALCLVIAPAFAADVAGKWTASFDTQIGVQNYTYNFKVDGNKFTGTCKSNIGEGEIVDGTINGDDVTFVENLKFQDQILRIDYKGKIAGDEMKLTRKVGEIATEELTAKRAK